MSDYDAGLLNDFGGGNVEWWHDYIRAEIGRCNDFHRAERAELKGRVEKATEYLEIFYPEDPIVFYRNMKRILKVTP